MDGLEVFTGEHQLHVLKMLFSKSNAVEQLIYIKLNPDQHYGR